MEILNWTWYSKYHRIKIYRDKKLIGQIPSFASDDVSVIMGKKYSVKGWRPFSEPSVIDPSDNMTYCKIEEISSEFFLHMPDIAYIATKNYNWPFKRNVIIVDHLRNPVIELQIPGGFFKDEGTIKLYREEHSELLLYLLFYLNTINED